MKICILGSANSAHVQRWVGAIQQFGHKILLISLYPGHIDHAKNIILPRTSKMLYIKNYFAIKKAINEFKPDILHAHHASSYGFLGALQGFHPFFISVWGYDVLLFPYKSPIHKQIIQYSLRKADQITATSIALSDATRKLTNKIPAVIPFGADFKLLKCERDYNRPELTIGIIKDLRPVYGISDLIKALSVLVKKNYPVKLVIVGEGYLKDELVILSKNLGIEDKVIIKERVPHDRIIDELREFDIFAMPSYSEGFGVAAVEAMATGLPVVASNVGGIPEIIDNGKTGILINSGDIEGLSNALEFYILHSDERKNHGLAGRKKVETEFDWAENAMRMEKLYQRVLKSRIQ